MFFVFLNRIFTLEYFSYKSVKSEMDEFAMETFKCFLNKFQLTRVSLFLAVLFLFFFIKNHLMKLKKKLAFC